MRRTFIAVILTLVFSPCARAQGPTLGFPPYGSFHDGGFDATNRQNLNVFFAVPIVQVPGRGQAFSFSVMHNSLVYKRNGSAWALVGTDVGWSPVKTTGTVTYRVRTFFCDHPTQPKNVKYYDNYAYTDEAGTRHAFDVAFYEIASACLFEPTGPRTGIANDGSGYYLDANSPTAPKVTAKDGIEVVVANTKDTNGNYFSKIIVNSTTTDWKDTLGRVVLTITTRTNCTYQSVTYPQCVDFTFKKPDGNSHTATLYKKAFNIKSNFGCSGVSEVNTSGNLPTLIVVPNGKSYSFDYEDTPSFSGYKTGRISKVTFPTTGFYEYEYPSPNNGINCSDGTVLKLKRKITAGGGATTHTWEYTRALNGSNWDLTFKDPVANETVFTFSGTQQISLKSYQGTAASGTLLSTVNTSWTSGAPSSTTVIVPDGSNSKQSKTDTTFDAYGNLTQSIEYDWDSNAPGAAVRTTQITYVTDSAYTAKNMRNLPSVILVRAGGASGTVKSRTKIFYDQTSYSNQSCPTGIPQHDDANYHCTFYTRGNPTTVSTYTDATGETGEISRHSYYDFFGNVTKADVNCCQQKEWTFSTATQYAFPDQVKNGPATGTQLITSATYNAYTSQVATSTDANNKQTSFAYDAFKRITSITVPHSPTNIVVTYAYNDDDRTLTVEKPIQGTDKVKQKTYFDPLGRPFKAEVSDTNGGSCSATQAEYDALSRPFKQYNPVSCGGSTTLVTQTAFDALGRVLSVTAPDNSQTSYSYSVITVTVTDPTGKQRKSESDALGRLKKVWEPDVNDNNSLTVETSYAYDVLDLLTQVTQGVQTRSYQYDDLGRLTQQTTPEGGTWTYGYNAFNLVTTRADARGVDTTYTYDTLNRLTGVSYDVSGTSVPSTASVTYTYDQGGATANALGRLTSVSDGVGSETFTYDDLGRVIQLDKAISGTTYTMEYEFNLASELTKITYPSGREVNQTYNPIGRLSSIASGSTTYAGTFGYNTAGQVTGFNYGNGVAASFGYSSERLQLTSLSYVKDSTTLLSLAYGYGSSGSNNSQIMGITDNTGTPEAGRSVTYTYDALHRLKTAVTTGSTAYPQWGLSWTYDRYGNRTNQTVTAGSGPPNSVTVSTSTNRITDTGYSYDANGNMTADGLNSMVYDAESRVATINSGAAEYLYDGAGLRVKKCAPNCTSPTSRTVYVFSGAKVIAEYDNGAAVGSPTREYIYSGSQLIASHEGGTLKYQMSDHLSARLITDSSGGVVEQKGHYPYGEVWYEASSGASKLKFTSYERDAESGNDYAIFRTHISRLGRFNRPDPIAGSIADPQSLNRYAYVRNDTPNSIDPDGMWARQLFPMGTPSVGRGGGYNCIVDGLVASCRMAFGFLQMEAIVRCPNDMCTRVRWSDNRPEEFRAFTNGEGWYAYTGPGSVHYSFESAGIAAGLAVNEAQDEQVEWGAEIYRDENGIYSFTEPRPGTATHFQADPNMVPPGTVFVGDVHTHLRGGSHTFTIQDQRNINALKATDLNYRGAFLVPWPGNVMWVYRPGIDKGWGVIIYPRRP